MSKADYEKAKMILMANKSKADFIGPRPEDLIRKAEDVLCVQFPPTYRSFLLENGAGNFGADKFFGVIDENFEKSSIPDGVWYTLTERKEVNLPNDQIVIGEVGTGELYCLDLTKNEGPVVIIDAGADINNREIIAPDFGAFLLDRVQKVSKMI